MQETRGRTVLVTGATKGIGLAVSQRLAAVGCNVLGVAREAAADFPGKLFSCDLSNAKKTSEFLGQIEDRPIDAIVNNVGIALPEPLGSIGLDRLLQVYDLNVRTAVQITQAVIEGMKERRWGRIVNIASRAILGSVNRTAYAAAKAALIGCTRTWALELSPFGITVNAVAPGPTETELFRQKHQPQSKEEQAAIRSIPMGRIGKPMEIAAAIVFFLSEEASYVTGQTLHVDGGGSLGSISLS